MKLPLTIAKQLLQMQQGNTIPAAQMRHAITVKLVDDNVLFKKRIGSNKNIYFVKDNNSLNQYIHNHFGIAELETYINKFEQENLTRAEAINISSNSKIKSIRSFKGFMVNCYQPIKATLNQCEILLQPNDGSFIFIHDFEQFRISPDIVIVGIENAENFRFIRQQQYLFNNSLPLFVSRYPQTQYGDIIQWLQSVPNPYLHFGDLDIEGINIYLREYKSKLLHKASFFIPKNVESLFQKNGNRNLYDKQIDRIPDIATIEETSLIDLLGIIQKYKKGLEQEVLIQY